MNTDSTTPSPSVYAIGIGLGLLAAGVATAFFAWYSLITTVVVKTASIFGTTPTDDPTAGAKAFLVTGGIASLFGAVILIIGIVQLALGIDYLVRMKAQDRAVVPDGAS